MAQNTRSSLINLNFSVTPLIELVQKDYWNCAKFLSNSKSHDFICHNLADLTWPQTTTMGATLSMVGQWLRCVFLLQVVEIINYEVSVSFLTAQRPQCQQVIIATNDGPMPRTRFFYLLITPPFFNAADFLHIGTLAGWGFHCCYQDFRRCPSLRHLCLESWVSE